MNIYYAMILAALFILALAIPLSWLDHYMQRRTEEHKLRLREKYRRCNKDD